MTATKLWYPFHIERYRRKTRHLTVAEHGAYRLLMDAYWDTRGPLPADETRLRKMIGADADEWALVRDAVLDFFELTDDGWRHHTIDEQIAEAVRQHEAKKARIAFARSKRGSNVNADDNVDDNADNKPDDGADGKIESRTPLPSPSPSPVAKNEEPKRAADAADVSREKKPSEIDEVRTIFREVLSEEITEALIKHRKKKRAAETAFAAKLLVDQLKRCRGGPEAAAKEMILRNWVSFKADWNDDNRPNTNGNGKPAFSGVVANLREMLDNPENDDTGRREPIPHPILLTGGR